MDGSVTLGAYVQEWLRTFKQCSVKQATYDRLVTSYDALKKHPISGVPIGDITPFTLQRYVNDLTHEYATLSTIKKQMRIVTSPLKHAAAYRLIPSDPTYGVKIPKLDLPQNEIETYSEEEQHKILNAVAKEGRPGGYAIALMLETGLRAGEALALRWRDVDIKAKRLRVTATIIRLANKNTALLQESPKSKTSRRTIPLTDKAIAILEHQKMVTTGQFVFDDGEKDKLENLSYEALRYQVQKVCSRAGVPFKGMHIFRHTFATNCYYKGVPVKILCKLLGHSSPSVTLNVYIHLYGDEFDELYAAINK